MFFYKVAILSSPLSTLTYHFNSSLKTGTIVNVLIRKRESKAVVLLECSKPEFKTNEIIIKIISFMNKKEAYRESLDYIQFKLKNLAKLEYPKHLTQIIVVDSNSEDQTVNLVNDFIIQHPATKGKYPHSSILRKNGAYSSVLQDKRWTLHKLERSVWR